MHKIDFELIEMTLDVMKYSIGQLTETNPRIGFPKTAEELTSLVGETISGEGIGGENAFKIFRDVLMKASISIDHPRHLAFVPASPTRAAVLFDLVTSAASVHGAYWLEGAGCIFAENQAMGWLVELTGMPKGAFGVFTSGGTEANLSAIVTAREDWRRKVSSKKHERGIIISAISAHSSIKAMAKIVDADVLLVPTEDRLEGAQLRELIDGLNVEDRNRLFAIIATAGTTNAGIIDDLEGVSKVCKDEGIWFHVDAAYGGGALASRNARPKFKGIENADSVTIDPHKWLFSPYDCGAVIYRNPELAKLAHSQEGSYLDIFSDESAFGFNPSDYQIQLTRRVRGLPLWFSLAMHGTKLYEEAIDRGIELAEIAGKAITDFEYTDLIREPSLSCVLFRRNGWTPQDYRDWTHRNHKSGYALVAPTKVRHGSEFETVARFCFINPDTTEEDICGILETMR